MRAGPRFNVDNVLGFNYWEGGNQATTLYLGAPRTFRLSRTADFWTGILLTGALPLSEMNRENAFLTPVGSTEAVRPDER